MINESTNVVDNVCVWDGNTQTWQPPQNTLMLVQSTTLAAVWKAVIVDKKITDWILIEEIGAGQINFTWDGSVLTTNQTKPKLAALGLTQDEVKALLG